MSKRSRLFRPLITLSYVVVIGCGVAACVEDPDDVAATSMPRVEVEQVLHDHIYLVDAELTAVGDTVRRSGCATDPSTLRQEGPPWWYSLTHTYRDVSDDQLDRLTSGVKALSAQGFEVGDVPTRDDPRDLSMQDARGFDVDMTVTDRAGEPMMVEVTSTSPCVRHPEGDDG